MAPARRHGFETPFHPFQVVSWGLIVFFVASFYSLLLLYTDTVGRAVAGVLFGLAAVATLIAAGLASGTDPGDKHIYEPPTHSPGQVVPGMLYCYRCERHVNDSSKHCTLCNKCIDNFDHHCVWLNNCVGTHNYRSFLGLLGGAGVMLSILIAVCIYCIVGYGKDQQAFQDRVHEFYPSLSGGAFFGLSIAILVVGLIAGGLVVQLLSFHIFLITQGLTTYDYVKYGAKNRRQQAQAAAGGGQLSPSGLRRPGAAAAPSAGGAGTGASGSSSDSLGGFPASPTGGAGTRVQQQSASAISYQPSPSSAPAAAAAAGPSGGVGTSVGAAGAVGTSGVSTSSQTSLSGIELLHTGASSGAGNKGSGKRGAGQQLPPTYIAPPLIAASSFEEEEDSPSTAAAPSIAHMQQQQQQQNQQQAAAPASHAPPHHLVSGGLPAAEVEQAAKGTVPAVTITQETAASAHRAAEKVKRDSVGSDKESKLDLERGGATDSKE